MTTNMSTFATKNSSHKPLLSVLLTFMLVLLRPLPVFADQKMNHSYNLDDPNIPWRQIKFISPQQNLKQSQWHSSIPVISGKGMDHLYLITQYVIDLLQPPGLPDDIIKEEVLDDPIPVLEENKGRVS